MSLGGCLPIEDQTLVDMLERASRDSQTGLRLLDRHEDAEFYPYPDVWRRALGVCGGLQGLGVEPGDRNGFGFAHGVCTPGARH